MSQAGGYALPERRPLQIFAFDPMLGRTAGNRVVVSVANEPLLPGPQGARVQVVDYDATQRVFYQPVDLDDPAVLMNQGLDPSESNPLFHQQMVYAVTMKVVENFEQALGRRLTFKQRKRLRLLPHGFEGRNAFYDPGEVAILFGYFRADRKDPGRNLPGQTVFTCLSHDIVAHEVTHAMVDRLRRLFTEDSNPDVSAFHEAFSDIVAIFQHFGFPAILADTIQRTRGDLRSPNVLGELAQQFGYATGSGEALRSAIDPDGKPDPRLYDRVLEPHERGSILVAAVFDAFNNVYQARIKDLVRIATGGTGRLPEGDLHPDLVNRIAGEASKTARTILKMCIRAFDYLPPVDVTFGDYLRALVTADRDAVPDDAKGIRAEMIEAFRRRGIQLGGVSSLAEEALVWPDREPDGLKLWFEPFTQALAVSAQAFDRGPRRRTRVAAPAEARAAVGQWAGLLNEYAKQHSGELGLDPRYSPPRLQGFHTVFRVSPDGQLVVELVAQFAQEDKSVRQDPAYGGVALLGGTTIIATAEGKIRYVISKPIDDERRKRLAEFVSQCDDQDAMLAWGGDSYRAQRMKLRSIARLHRRIAR